MEAAENRGPKIWPGGSYVDKTQNSHMSLLESSVRAGLGTHRVIFHKPGQKETARRCKQNSQAFTWWKDRRTHQQGWRVLGDHPGNSQTQ